MTADRPITILIGALGGQGGGVLVDWMATAAETAGFPAQATSTPGVAQRTGATTYYFEIFPDRDAPLTPIFSLFPCSGELDLMAAMEPTEAGRALERGWITDITTVVTASERMYSTAEKISAGDGTIPTGPVLDALGNAAKSLVTLKMRELATASPLQGNAVLFGAIAASGILPFGIDACRAAIQTRGIAVESNLAGFDTGVAAAQGGGSSRPGDAEKDFKPAPDALQAEVAAYPENLRPLIGHALARLADYQSVAYGRKFLDRLAPVLAADDGPDKRLTAAVAKRLAAWMSYEDVIRVAQLKTRPGRLGRIRSELNLDEEIPLAVTDYFKPGREEIAGLLPRKVADMFGHSTKPTADRGIPLHIPTGNAFGYALLKTLTLARPFRRFGRQFADEQAAIENWLAAVLEAAKRDYALACRTAEAAIWARGYGGVRHRGLQRLETLFTDWPARLDADKTAVAAAVDTSLILAHGDPDADAATVTKS